MKKNIIFYIILVFLASGVWSDEIHKAAAKGNLVKTKELIQDNLKLLQLKDRKGRTPLAVAAWYGHVNLIKYLSSRGAGVNTRDRNGLTPLFSALDRGKTRVASLLIQLGADVKIKGYRNRTLLHMAAIKGRTQMAGALLDHKAVVNARDGNGHSPLYLARRYGHPSLAGLLKTRGGSLGDNKLPAGTGDLLAGRLRSGEAVLFYLGHCGWAIKTTNHFLVFDYYNWGKNPSNPSLANGHINPEEIKNLKVRVFVTHGHADHFDPVIFGWQKKVKDIKYIYGFKADHYSNSRGRGKKKAAYSGPPYIMVGPRQKKNIDGLQIDALKSNDAGVGFLVKADGVSIYHAGWREKEKTGYIKEIDYISRLVKNLDFAFINVTGCHARCNTALEGGAKYTLEKLTPKTWFPTHAGEKEHIYAQFAHKVSNKKITTNVVCPENRGRIYMYKEGKIQVY